MHRASRRPSWLVLLLLCAMPAGLRAQARGEIHGRLAESASGAAVASGSVTIVRAADGKFAGGALPAADGSFKVEALAFGRYTVRVRALGFAPVTRADVVLSAEKPVVDVGTLTLSRVATRLGPQVVTGEREDVQLAPDRNVYSTKNMATAAGGTAIDVLRNIPSVEVDASNQITLRGNASVVVQINGRTSPLKGEQLGNFLAQLPASAIKRVEVATNPSAKDDPEGTAGILNIVLNQDTEMGLSGGLYVGAGSTGQVNASGNVGRQQGKLIWLLSYGLFTNDQQTGGYSDLTNLAIARPAFVHSRITGSAKPVWQNGMVRTEYRFTPHDALSLDAMLSGGQFSRDNASYFTDLDSLGSVIGLFDQFSNGSSRNAMMDYDLAFRRTGNARDRTFSTELDLSRTWGRNTNDLFGVVHQGDPSTGVLPMSTENDLAHIGVPSLTWQGDFSQPFGTGSKIEAGFKEILRHSTSDFAAAYLDTATGAFVPQPSRSNAFDYREQIGAAYALVSQRVGKVQAQGGLRLEQASTRLGLPLAPADSQRFDDRYASAYPSGILSYNFTPTRQAKVSYSRRVSRPYPQQLSPIEFRQDARTLFRGNPNLRPEYTDAIELGFQDSHGWGTLQLNPYIRHTAHAVRFIQTTDTTGVTLGTFENVASTLETGADLNVSIHKGPLMILTGGNAYRYRSDAANLAGNLSTNAWVWSARVSGTWNVTKSLDAQLFTNYRSPYRTEGAKQRPMVFMNIALRQKLWGDKGSLTLRVMDPFNLMTFGSTTINPRVVQSTVRHFGMRGVYLTFSRNWGQALKLRPKQSEDQPPAGPVGP